MDYSKTIKTFDDFQVGDKACFAKTITDAEVCLFAGITGDLNPLHIDDQYAQSTRFGRRVVHGIFGTGLISTTLTLLGTGCVYLSQEVRFKRPVFVGDTITAEAEIIEKRPEKNILIVKTTCTNQKGEVVIDGQAALMALKELKPEA